MKEIIINEIQRIAKLLDKTPTREEVINNRSNIAITKRKINEIFGTYTDALIAANLNLKIDNRNKGKQEVKCKTCQVIITKNNSEINTSENQFCSKSCAAIFNNTVYIKRPTTTSIVSIKYIKKEHHIDCINCNKNFLKSSNQTTNCCSRLCQTEQYMKSRTLADTIVRIRGNKFDTARSNARSYSKHFYPKHCMKCGYDKHYEVCHIEDLTSQDTSKTLFEVNHITNLIHLCPNCHWEFDHNLTDEKEIRSIVANFFKLSTEL